MASKQLLESLQLKLDNLLAEVLKINQKFDNLKVCPSTNCICITSVFINEPTLPPPIVIPSISIPLKAITKSNVMLEIIDLGVASNGEQYKVIVFDDGKIRVYISTIGGYKQITEATKASMGPYLTGPFIAPKIQNILWNEIEIKLFPEEIK